MNWDLPSITGSAAFLLALLSIAFGLLICFFGYRIFRVMLGVYGFFLGAAAGFALVASTIQDQTLWLILGALIGGIVGAGVLVVFYWIGIFILGAVTGAILIDSIGLSLGVDMPTLVIIIVAVVAGIAALLFQRIAIILTTAISGSWTAVSGVFSLISGQDLAFREVYDRTTSGQRIGLPLLAVILVWLVLAIAGAVVQFRGNPAPEAT